MKTHRFSRGRACKRLFPLGPMAGLLLAALLFLMSAVAQAQSVPTDMEQAVLAENWHQVWEALGSEESDPESAVLRLIKGHACLALNRNNQSLELFASTLNDDDRTAWQAWADRLAEKHRDNAIAWYFKGDAHARRKEWKAAADCFDKAIGLDEECHLALNARGVVYHAVGNTLMARVYFVKATKAEEDFADAYASRGMLNICCRSAKRAGECFRTAADCSEDLHCVLLDNGLGCSSYGAQRYGEAKRFFKGVRKVSILSPLARRNHFAAEIADLRRIVRHTDNTGTTLESFVLQNRQGQLALLQGRDANGRTVYSLVLPDGSKLALTSDSNVFPPRGPLYGGNDGVPFYDGDEPEVQEGDGYRLVIFKKRGRVYMIVIEVMVKGKWTRVPLTPEAYQMILELLRQGKKITVEVKIVSGITVVIIYADGKPVWEIHYGPGGEIIWQGPPGEKPRAEGKGRVGGGMMPEPQPGTQRGAKPPVVPESLLDVLIDALPQIPRTTDVDMPSLVTSANLSDLTDAVASVRRHIQQEITTMQRPTAKTGGADSDPTGVPVNRGRWGVCNVYGLLYAVPVAQPKDKSQGPKK